MMTMALFQEIRTRVKNTFLELVEDDEEPQPTASRAKTDSLAFRRSCCAWQLEAEESEGSTSEGSHSGSLSQDESSSDEEKTAQGAGGAQRAGGAAFLGGNEECRHAPSSGSRAPAAAGPAGKTTVMLRNLPNDYNRAMLLQLLDSEGFLGCYDFVYLPIDFDRRAGLGYAFVNMVSAAEARRIHRHFEGFRRWAVRSGKVCSVGWSKPCQGLEANVQYFKNSSVMHASVPEEYKPVVLLDGRQVEFPKPSKKIRPPEAGKAGRKLRVKC